MLGHYALMDKVFETPGWSRVVMVAPTRLKRLKPIGWTAIPAVRAAS
jgi:hypothetical protein